MTKPSYASLMGSWMGIKRGQCSPESLSAQDAAERTDMASSFP